MMSVILLTVILLSVILLSVVILIVVKLSVVILRVCYVENLHAECRYTKCCFTECCGALYSFKVCVKSCCHGRSFNDLSPVKMHLNEPNFFGDMTLKRINLVEVSRKMSN
jgi:hypothetical protein